MHKATAASIMIWPLHILSPPNGQFRLHTKTEEMFILVFM